MMGGSAGRGRRVVWAILSFLFVAGFAVSTIVVRSERNEALDDVAERARDQAQLVTNTLTGRQLTKPVTGSSYDDLANKIWKSVSSKGSIVGVTVWSSRGRVLFSLNESRVGNTPLEMRSLITRTATGSGSTRVLDDIVQTFTPISKAPNGPVAIVEVDQPLAIVDARIDLLWTTLRVGSVFGLAVSFLLLGFTFVKSKRRVREPASVERPRQEAVAEVKAEGQKSTAAPTEQRKPTYDEIFGVQTHHDHDEASDGAELDGDVEHQKQQSVERPREEVHDMSPDGDLEHPTQPSMEKPREEVQVMAPDGDHQSQESSQESSRESMPEPESREEPSDALENDPRIQAIRQRREAFKARAQEARIRLEKAETDLHETSSGRKSER